MFVPQSASVEQLSCKPPDFGFLAQALAAGATGELVERLADKYVSAYAEYCAHSGTGQVPTGGIEGLELGGGKSAGSSMLSVSVGSSVSAVVESGRCYTWLTVAKRSKALRKQLGLWPSMRQVLTAPAVLYDLEKIRRCVLVRQGPGLYHVERQGSALYVWQVLVELAERYEFPEGSLGEVLASERAPRPVESLSLSCKIGGKVPHTKVASVPVSSDSGYCYLELVLPECRSLVVRELGPEPSFLTLLDSSVQWFDYAKFDECSIRGTRQVAHLQSGEGVTARSIFGQLARECHPVSGTLAAVAVSWVSTGEFQFDYDTRLGGGPDVAGAVSVCEVLEQSVRASAGRDETLELVVDNVSETLTMGVKEMVVAGSGVCEVQVPEGKESVLVADSWFQVEGLSFEPAIMDFGTTRMVYIKRPGAYSLGLITFQSSAKVFQLSFDVGLLVGRIPLAVALGSALGLYVGSVEQVTSSMELDFFYNSSRLPLCYLRGGIELFGGCWCHSSSDLALPFVDKRKWLAETHSDHLTLRDVALKYDHAEARRSEVGWLYSDGVLYVGMHAPEERVNEIFRLARDALDRMSSCVWLEHHGRRVSLGLDTKVVLVG